MVVAVVAVDMAAAAVVDTAAAVVVAAVDTAVAVVAAETVAVIAAVAEIAAVDRITARHLSPKLFRKLYLHGPPAECRRPCEVFHPIPVPE